MTRYWNILNYDDYINKSSQNLNEFIWKAKRKLCLAIISSLMYVIFANQIEITP